MIKRTIILTVNGVKKEVIMLHYIGWPDHDVPSGTSMKEFQILMDHFTKWLLLNTDND